MSNSREAIRFLTGHEFSPSNAHPFDASQRFLSLGDFESYRSDDGEWAYQARLRIKEFSYLTVDWDSYGAPDVGSQAISRAIEFVPRFSTLPLRPLIAPTPEGGVQFEWSTADNAQLLLEVEHDGRIELFYVLPSGAEWCGPLGAEPDDLRTVYVEVLGARSQ